jgi:hypothetical protein
MMHRNGWSRIVAATFVVVLLAGLGTAQKLAAYPGGTPRLVTNTGPGCTNCHSSVNADQLRDVPADAQASLLIEGRHFKEINEGEENYQKLSPADREKLITAIMAIDSHSSVSLAASATNVKKGAPLTVTVTTKGGGGPVIGVMLTDNDLRYQSSPVQVEGFLITAAPQVTGPDGKPQTKFLDGRAAGLMKNINYVNIQDVKSDPDAGTYPECKVVYALQAPSAAGEYTISAAFLYGTEKATTLGRVEGPGGRVYPLGGGGAHSGRVAFAKPLKVVVQ